MKIQKIFFVLVEMQMMKNSWDTRYHNLVGWPTVLVCQGLRGFLGCHGFCFKTQKVAYIKSLCCTPSTNAMLYVNGVSAKLEDGGEITMHWEIRMHWENQDKSVTLRLSTELQSLRHCNAGTTISKQTKKREQRDQKGTCAGVTLWLQQKQHSSSPSGKGRSVHKQCWTAGDPCLKNKVNS